MGRDSWSDRKTVEECLSLDVFKLNRWGYFCGFQSGILHWKNSLGEVTSSIGIAVSVSREGFGEDYVRLSYSQTDRFTAEKRRIWITRLSWLLRLVILGVSDIGLSAL